MAFDPKQAHVRWSEILHKYVGLRSTAHMMENVRMEISTFLVHAARELGAPVPAFHIAMDPRGDRLLVSVAENADPRIRAAIEGPPEMTDYFPIKPTPGMPFPTRVPRSLAEEAYSQYCAYYPAQADLDTIEKAGGFTALNFAYLLAGKHPDHRIWHEDEKKIIEMAWARVSQTETEIGRLQKELDEKTKELELMRKSHAAHFFKIGGFKSRINIATERDIVWDLKGAWIREATIQNQKIRPSRVMLDIVVDDIEVSAGGAYDAMDKLEAVQLVRTPDRFKK